MGILLKAQSSKPEKRLRVSTKPAHTKVSWLMGYFSAGLPIWLERLIQALKVRQ